MRRLPETLSIEVQKGGGKVIKKSFSIGRRNTACQWLSHLCIKTRPEGELSFQLLLQGERKQKLLEKNILKVLFENEKKV